MSVLPSAAAHLANQISCFDTSFTCFSDSSKKISATLICNLYRK